MLGIVSSATSSQTLALIPVEIKSHSKSSVMEYTEDCAYLFSCNMPHYDLNAQWKTIDGQMKKMITKD